MKEVVEILRIAKELVSISLEDRIKQGGRAPGAGWYLEVENHPRGMMDYRVYVGPFPTEEIGVMIAAWHRNSNSQTSQPVYHYDTDTIRGILDSGNGKFISPGSYRKWVIHGIHGEPTRIVNWKEFVEHLDEETRGSSFGKVWE